MRTYHRLLGPAGSTVVVAGDLRGHALAEQLDVFEAQNIQLVTPPEATDEQSGWQQGAPVTVGDGAVDEPSQHLGHHQGGGGTDD